MAAQRILVVDDEAEVRTLCWRKLSQEGYDVCLASNGTEALLRAREQQFHLAILDIVMPGISGFELCSSLRALEGLSDLPILFLTGKSDITDKAVGYGIGADDYLTKPFDVRELAMRVRALLRRAPTEPHPADVRQLHAGRFHLDGDKFTITTPEKTVALTAVEFGLAYYLLSHSGRVCSSAVLLKQVWGYAPGLGSSDVVRAHVKNLRQKIEPDPSDPRYLRTVGRLGYMMEE